MKIEKQSLHKKDYDKLTIAQEKFLVDASFLNKDAVGYLKFLEKYDRRLYKKLLDSEEPIIMNLKNKNQFDGWSSADLLNITEIILENINKNGLDSSDPKEQKLFKAVWKINKDCKKECMKFSPYKTFKKVNDKEKYISSDLIQPSKFSLSPIYNRYRQYRKKEQKIK